MQLSLGAERRPDTNWKRCARSLRSGPCRSGLVSKDRVHADLAELASGRKQGRLTAVELVIFESIGSGVQDVAAAWLPIRRPIDWVSAYVSICQLKLSEEQDVRGCQ